MGTKEQNIQANIPRWGAILLNLPWIQVAGELWKIGRKMWRGYANEGVYEVLDYEATLELLNKKGTQAAFQKRLRVRYLQDNIIAFQDSAWGDGEILVNYKCIPGIAVDKYRSGFKTHVLLSLRKIKNRGDIDEFNIKCNP